MQKYETHRVKPRDRERIKCTNCGSPADVCQHNGPPFFYYCDPCFAGELAKDAEREAQHAESAKAFAEAEVYRALQTIKDAILTDNATDGTEPAWQAFLALRAELVQIKAISH